MIETATSVLPSGVASMPLPPTNGTGIVSTVVPSSPFGAIGILKTADRPLVAEFVFVK